jgi:hypothetical protein
LSEYWQYTHPIARIETRIRLGSYPLRRQVYAVPPIAVGAMVVEITKRKRIEEALKLSEEKYRPRLLIQPMRGFG